MVTHEQRPLGEYLGEITRLKSENDSLRESLSIFREKTDEYYAKFFDEVRRREDVGVVLADTKKERDRLMAIVENLAKALDPTK